MRIRITHTTTYSYSKPIWLEQHIVRLRPRCDGTQRLLRFELQVEPRPTVFADTLDAEGNAVAQICFRGVAERLTVASTVEVETLRTNPFDYFLDPAAESLPFHAGDEHLARRLPRQYIRPDGDATVAQFARGIAEESGWRTLDFLSTLNTRIHSAFGRIIREKGIPWEPAVTLARREGSCRDVAVLFIAACGVMGIPARFVSGYQRGSGNSQRRFMHAWPEVFLPGGGWRGYDPTHGLAVADHHVAVAACSEPKGAAPIEGTFRGTGAASRMEAQVEIAGQTDGALV